MENNRIWHLIARKLSRESTLEELRELEQLLQADPQLAYQTDLYTQYYEQPVRSIRNAEEIDQSWESVSARLLQQFPGDFAADASMAPAAGPSGLRKKVLFAVASLLCVLGVGYWSMIPFHSSPVAAVPVVHEMNTLPGTRTKLTLPDGTLVWMNSDSHLFYNADFGKTKREITLSGEAFFDVAANAKVPMVVHARSVNIWVLGTAFNVRSYPDAGKVETSLLRGSVELSTNADPGRKILLKPNEKITIETTSETKNIKAAVPKPAVADVRKPYFQIDILRQSALTNTIPEVSWIDNKLVFDNEPFAEVMAKMEKWYNMEIVLKNKELSGKQVSGVFDKEDIGQALSALQMTIQFNFSVKGKKVFIR